MTHQDLTIASLKILIYELQEKVSLSLICISASSKKAKQAVATKDRTAALAALKSKRLHEDVLKERLESLSRLEEIYNKIEQAADHVAMLRVMEGSTTVLQSLREETGGIEKAEYVIEQLREETNEIDRLLTAFQAEGQDNAVIDDDVVDQELEIMLEDAKVHQESQQASDTAKQLTELEATDKVPNEKLAEKAQIASLSTDETTRTLERFSINECRRKSNTPETTTMATIQGAG